MGSVGHLVGNLAETDDGAGHELGKEGNVAGKIDEIAQRLRLTAVHINSIAQQMKGVKTDAQRQRDPQDGLQPYCGYSQPAEQGVVILQSEVEVLEKSQNGQARADGNKEPDFFLPQARSARSRNPR